MAQGLSQKIGVGTKILMIAGSFILPIAVLVYLMLGNINEFINFAVLEQKGNAIQRPLENTLKSVEEFQVGYFLNNTPDWQAAWTRSQDDFQALGSAFDRLGADLQFTDDGLGKRDRSGIKFDAVRNRWSEIGVQVNSADANRDEVQKKIAGVVSDIRTMIVHAGDTSNLILDPDLDSYYLMDVTLIALPQMQQRLAEIAMQGASLLDKPALSEGDRVFLSVQAALLQQSDLDRAIGSYKTALNEDRNFYGISDTLQTEVSAGMEKLNADVGGFLAVVNRVGKGQRIDKAEWIGAANKALQTSFSVWNISVKELDTLLARRIQYYVARKNTSMGLSAFALLVASLIAFAVSKSITNPLLAVTKLLGPGWSSPRQTGQSSQRLLS